MNDLLKFITCGSVDDGKSTLIGHMLYDAKLLFADQEKALVLDSKVGSREGAIDYSLLLDGLMAEREQGITIDVAYRYFTTDNRSFIVADTPGHEEYTRNMAVGASFADLSIILIDATQGVLVQTKRHARICKLMGINYFVFAVNKMDLADYSEEIFNKIEKQIHKLSKELELDNVKIIPVSATAGDNVTVSSDKMPWYDGEPILTYLENVDIKSANTEKGFYMPVQRVCRPNHAFRGFQGQIEADSVAVGDTVTVLPSNEKAAVKSIFVGNKESENAFIGQPVTITLDREIDVSRGCVLTKDSKIDNAKAFNAYVLWLDRTPLSIGGEYLIKLGTQKNNALVKHINYKIDINTGEHIDDIKLEQNEIANCEFEISAEIIMNPNNQNSFLNKFILINKVSNNTAACGIITRKINLFPINYNLNSFNKKTLNQKSLTVWITGLSGGGKTTLATLLKQRLNSLNRFVVILDGDNIRNSVNKDLEFNDADRFENIRRIAEISKLMNDENIITIVSAISPLNKHRILAKTIVGENNYLEIYVSTPLKVCIKRDCKGLYEAAKNNNVSFMTGIDSIYEKPNNSDITINMTMLNEKNINDIVKRIYCQTEL